MSNLDNLQSFIKARSIRPPNQDPHDAQEEYTGLSDEEMREANVRAVEEARKTGKSTLTPRQQEMANVIEEGMPQKPKEMPLLEKDGGGGGAGGDGGAGGAGGLSGGGTVAVASDPGVFTPTYGGSSKRKLGMADTKKKKKKKEKDKTITTGVTKVDRFLRDEEVNQTRKMDNSVQDFAQWVINEARTELIQLDAKKENVNTGEINEPPRIASKPTSLGSQKVKNPHCRRGKFGAAPGQQGVSRDQYDHHFRFTKMQTITKVLNSNPSVLSLLKALDTDVPMGVN